MPIQRSEWGPPDVAYHVIGCDEMVSSFAFNFDFAPLQQGQHRAHLRPGRRPRRVLQVGRADRKSTYTVSDLHIFLILSPAHSHHNVLFTYPILTSKMPS